MNRTGVVMLAALAAAALLPTEVAAQRIIPGQHVISLSLGLPEEVGVRAGWGRNDYVGRTLFRIGCFRTGTERHRLRPDRRRGRGSGTVSLPQEEPLLTAIPGVLGPVRSEASVPSPPGPPSSSGEDTPTYAFFRSSDFTLSGGYLFRVIGSRSRNFNLWAGGSLALGARIHDEKYPEMCVPKAKFIYAFLPEVQVEAFPSKSFSIYAYAAPYLQFYGHRYTDRWFYPEVGIGINFHFFTPY